MFEKQKNIFEGAYDAGNFRKQGYEIIDTLADYLSSCMDRDNPCVLSSDAPGKVLEKWDTDFNDDDTSSFDLVEFITEVVSKSIHIHHPKYIGHQVSAPLPEAVLADTVSAMLNNSNGIFELGPVNTAMEKICIRWMANQIGYGSGAEGFFTSGGSLGNLTALLTARQAKTTYDIWNEGLKPSRNLAVMVSEQAHYSVKRAVQVMGLGEKGAILVPSDKNFKMDIDALKEKYEEAKRNEVEVFAIVASDCSTASGSYDNIDAIADFCEQNNIWLHVDGAHGASALLSDKYKHLLKGAHRADSIIWDSHKMMMMPALITAVIFKNGQRSYETFSQKASYLLSKDNENKWSELGLRTMECTKTMMGLKFYTTLKSKGKKFFASYIDYVYDLTKWFARELENTGVFQLAVEPECNIICFRFTGKKGELNEIHLNEIQMQIRNKIAESEEFYIVKTILGKDLYLRCTIINPLTSKQDLLELIKKIRSYAEITSRSEVMV
jgi:L-2,4-diaminobutyrate decarboxylase